MQEQEHFLGQIAYRAESLVDQEYFEFEFYLLDENNNPKALLLNTGEEVPCELVVVATGVRSNIAFMENSNVECDRFGLIIDAKGQTNVENIYGAGDVTGRNPIWPTAVLGQTPYGP